MNKYILCENSQLQKQWTITQNNFEVIEAIKSQFSLSYLTSSVLANRYIEIKEIENYLNPTLKNNWPEIAKLPDIEIAAKKIIDAINNKSKIGILGDYDVDGITSAALWDIFLKEVGQETFIWLPNRTQSYGPGQEALDFFEQENVDLLIIVDCGTSATEFCKKYTKPMIIIDHHIATEMVQNQIIINPHRTDQNINEQEQFKNLCACGLSFLTMSYIIQKMNKNDEFKKEMLEKTIDLVALATICDIMEIDSLNKALVSKGLKILELQKKTGLKAIIQKSQTKFPLTSCDIGFNFGPKINAAARMDNAYIAFELLTTKNEDKAYELAAQLEKLNHERKTLQELIFQEVFELAKEETGKIICLYSKNWSAGIVGIIAAMIEKEFNKPTIIGTLQKDINNKEMIKASARSSTINIGKLIGKASLEKIITSGGGHKFAGGLSASKEEWENFKKFKEDIETEEIQEVELKIDAIINLDQIESDYKKLAPHGLGNEEIKILSKNLKIKNITELEKSIRITLEQNLKTYTFFIIKRNKKLIEKLEEAHKAQNKISLAIKLGQKGFNNIEDFYIEN